MKPLKLKPANDRGFLRGDFLDEYGEKCSIQKSSLATKECIWLGANENRMHLSRTHVEQLLPLLQHFVETGALPDGRGPKEEWCDNCDGCGWFEGSESLQTTCGKCKGTGVVKIKKGR